MTRALRFTVLFGLILGLAALSVLHVSAQAAQTPAAPAKPPAAQPPAKAPAPAPQAPAAQAAAPAAPVQAAPAQPAAPPPPPPVNQSDDPVLKTFRWRSIGPASMSGRIDDLAVVEGNQSVFYVGFATGGIWKTVNAGTTFSPIFDSYSTHSIGDIAIAPSNPNILYVGTGEPNNRQSSSFGDGVYKSKTRGRSSSTWASGTRSRSRG